MAPEYGSAIAEPEKTEGNPIILATSNVLILFKASSIDAAILYRNLNPTKITALYYLTP